MPAAVIVAAAGEVPRFSVPLSDEAPFDDVDAIVSGCADDQFAAAVLVEISGGERGAELIAWCANDCGPRVGRGQLRADRPSGDVKIDRTAAAARPGRADGEILWIGSVGVNDVPGRSGVTEQGPCLRRSNRDVG